MSLSIDLGSALSSGSVVQSQWSFRAQVQWSRILDKPTDIELKRGDVFLPVQTVRLEPYDTFSQDAVGDSGISAFRRFMLFGVRGHPTIDDLDIDEWDSFVMEEKEFIVISVNRNLIGQIQAFVEAIG